MKLHLKNRLETGITVVSNEFIDQYMAEANGEYIKVYLYLLRYDMQGVTVEAIADALNHTEADVRRALSYWQKAGVLSEEVLSPEPVEIQKKTKNLAAEEASAASDSRTGGKAAKKRNVCTQKEIEKLSQDAEFSQLLYIAQKYLNKTFTPRECEVFVYLYGTLRMSAELLEYLVEYCAQNGHTSIRYIETVAINWYERKLLTVEEAKAYSRTFSKDSFAVMKALGLTGRSPGDTEYEMMDRWFRSYGFTRELVVEACNRTLRTIHKPDFRYLDGIMKGWKNAGVATLRDVEELDRIREEKRQREKKAGKQPQSAQKTGTSRAGNRFHNFEEHGYDYDKMVWNIINSESQKE